MLIFNATFLCIFLFLDVSSAAGAVSNLKWTPDGGALAMTWDKGGLAIWSVFGALLMCSLGWDYG